MKQNMMQDSAFAQDHPVASFTIGGRTYFIFPDGRKKGIKQDRQDSQPLAGYSFDGDLRIGDTRYRVATSETREAPFESAQRAAHNLSSREWEIVTRVAEGYANKQIADLLHISEWTVSTHMRRIFAKLGVDSRAAMVFKCSNVVRKQMQI